MDEDEARGISESLRTTDRLLALSDGVFAFALTLLALALTVPDGLTPSQLRTNLLELLPKLVSYVISVVMTGIYWMAHQRMFRFIKCYNHTLLWLNLLFLMSITLIPPLTLLLREYPRMQVSIIAYTTSLTSSTVLLLACWLYATSKPYLVTSDLDRSIVRYYATRSSLYFIVFLLTIVIALFNPLYAQYALPVLMAILALVDRRLRPSRA